VGVVVLQDLQVAAHLEGFHLRALKGLAAQVAAIRVTVVEINSRTIRLAIRATLSN
jgi:hypothetical protein